MACGEKINTETATDNGPVDALYQAIKRISGYAIKLTSYKLSANGQGKDAFGQVNISVEFQENHFHGVGLATDIIASSAHALIHALNNI